MSSIYVHSILMDIMKNLFLFGRVVVAHLICERSQSTLVKMECCHINVRLHRECGVLYTHDGWALCVRVMNMK